MSYNINVVVVIAFGKISWEFYKVLLRLSLRISCVNTYSISDTPGAMGQVSLPLTDLQPSNDMVCPYENVTDRPGKYSKFIHCH